MTPAQIASERLAREMHHITIRIDTLTRYGRPSPDSASGRVLKSFEAKRATLLALHGPAAAMPAPIRTMADANNIKFAATTWQPAGSIKLDDVIGDIPASLRRVRA